MKFRKPAFPVLLTSVFFTTALSGTAVAYGVDDNSDEGRIKDRVDVIMERHDFNADGVIDQRDREAQKAKRFAQADLNSDGVLTKEELVAASEVRREERAAKRAARAERRRDRMIDRLDGDGDGALSYEEFSTSKDRGESRRGVRGHKLGKHPGRRGGGPRMLKKADANGDGTVTREELEAAIIKRRERYNR